MHVIMGNLDIVNINNEQYGHGRVNFSQQGWMLCLANDMILLRNTINTICLNKVRVGTLL